MDVNQIQAVQNEAVASIMKALGVGGNDVQKATISSGTGLYGYSLEQPAKMLIPTLTSWARNIARKVMPTGFSHEYKRITSVSVVGKSTAAEGKRGAVASIATDHPTLSLGKLTSGVFNVTYDAEKIAGSFDNALGRATMLRLLNALRNECAHIPWGNVYALPVATVTPAENTAVAGVLNSSYTYYVYVRPVTGMALQKAQLAGAVRSCTYKLVSAVKYWTLDPSTIGATPGSPAVDLTDGYGAPSTVQSVATPGATSSLDIAWTACGGAAGYAIFVGHSTGITNASLQAVVGPVLKCTLLNVSTGGTKASSTTAVVDGYGTAGTVDTTADTSKDANDYLGIIPGLYGLTADNALTASGCYQKTLGASLSALNGTGIPEIDDMLTTQYQRMLGVDDVVLICGGGMRKVINAAYGAGASSSVLRIVAPAGPAQQDMTAGLFVSQYIHPVTNRLIPIVTDPNMWDGMVVSRPLSVPYPNSEIEDPVTVWLNYDWAEFDYAITEPSRNFELQCRGGVANYIPVAWGILDDIRTQ